MFFSRFGVLLVLFCLISAGAFARGSAPAREGDPQYYNFPLRSHAGDLNTSIDFMESKWDGTQSEFDSAVNRLGTTIDRASRTEKEWQDAMRKHEEKVRSLEARRQEVVRQIKNYDGGGSSQDIDKLQGDLSKMKKEQAALEAEARALESEAKDAKEGLSTYRNRLQTQYGKYMEKADTSFQSNDLDGMKKAFAAEIRGRKVQDKLNLVTQLFDRTSDDYLQSKLLFKDVKKLEEDLKNDKERIQFVEDVAFGRIDRTLMGKYVNDKVEKALGKACALKEKCGLSSVGVQGASQLDKTVEAVQAVTGITQPVTGDPQAKIAK